MIEPEFLNYIKSDDTILEKEPLEEIVKGQLMAYKHDGFWHAWIQEEIKIFLKKFGKVLDLIGLIRLK